jgi:hypothetical protein
MHFSTKNYLKSNRYHIVKHSLNLMSPCNFQVFKCPIGNVHLNPQVLNGHEVSQDIATFLKSYKIHISKSKIHAKKKNERVWRQKNMFREKVGQETKRVK